MAASRRYSTTLRAEQTRLTRRRILEAAGALFVERGYLGTTLNAVAAAAGVSVQSVYNVVGGKSVLLKAVYDTMLAGDDEPLTIGDRPMVVAIMEATDGRECLARYARMARMLGERISALLTMVLAQAAGGDSDLATFAEVTEGERSRGTTACAEHVAQRFGLRPGLDVEGAADVLWSMTAPELVDRLVRRRGWHWDRYEQWLGQTLAEALLGPEEVGRPVVG